MSRAKQKLLVNIRSRTMLPKYDDQQLTDIASSVGLTLTQLRELHSAAYSTYAYIGADLSECNGGKPFSRYQIVEVVLDANHMEIAVPGLSQGVKEWLRDCATKFDLDVVYAAVAAGFPYPNYE